MAGPTPFDDEHYDLLDDGEADGPSSRGPHADEDEGEEGEDDAVNDDGGDAAGAGSADKAAVTPPTLNSAKLVRVPWVADGYVCFDFETTGGKKQNNTIISIAAVFVNKDGVHAGEPCLGFRGQQSKRTTPGGGTVARTYTACKQCKTHPLLERCFSDSKRWDHSARKITSTPHVRGLTSLSSSRPLSARCALSPEPRPGRTVAYGHVTKKF